MGWYKGVTTMAIHRNNIYKLLLWGIYGPHLPLGYVFIRHCVNLHGLEEVETYFGLLGILWILITQEKLESALDLRWDGMQKIGNNWYVYSLG